MSDQIMNVIIPTRERADTLLWTLKTCVEQNFERLNIIVCDNFSADNTKDVVDSYNDRRITYVNPGRRLSMTQNWEFALSHVSDGFVTVIGDDDGLLPHAVNDVSRILNEESVSALSWMKSEYCWPSHVAPEWRNFLSIPLEKLLVEMPTASVSRDVSRFLLPYSRTPTLYNSFVDFSVIKAIMGKNGSFLNSLAPDIYSGIALLSEMDKYLYSIHPFSVNGASSHSNGTSANFSKNKDAVKKFMSELKPEETEMLGLVAGSVHSVFAESLFQANQQCHDGKLPVNKKIVLFFILREMANKGEEAFANALDDIHIFAERHGLVSFLKFCLQWIKPKESSSRQSMVWGLDHRNVLNVDASRFGISNVYDAAQFVYATVGCDRVEKRVKYSGMSRIYSTLLRRIDAVNMDVTL